MNWCTIFHSRNCFWKFVCKQWTILPWGQRVKALIWSGYICQIGNFKLMWHLFESQLADEQIFIQENVIFNENVVSKSERFLLALSFFQQTDQSNDIKKMPDRWKHNWDSMNSALLVHLSTDISVDAVRTNIAIGFLDLYYSTYAINNGRWSLHL